MKKVVTEDQAAFVENGKLVDKDLRTLNGLNRHHRKELDMHSEALQKMEDCIKGLCRVVNKQTTRIQELQEALDANNNIIETQQEWIAKMRGRREYNCGLVDPLLATVSGVGVEGSKNEEEEELEYEDAENPGTTLLGTG